MDREAHQEGGQKVVRHHLKIQLLHLIPTGVEPQPHRDELRFLARHTQDSRGPVLFDASDEF